MVGMDFIHFFIIHDNCCKLIHTTWHYKSFHGDIEYHMTLNTIFSVVRTQLIFGTFPRICTKFILDHNDVLGSNRRPRSRDVSLWMSITRLLKV